MKNIKIITGLVMLFLLFVACDLSGNVSNAISATPTVTPVSSSQSPTSTPPAQFQKTGEKGPNGGKDSMEMFSKISDLAGHYGAVATYPLDDPAWSNFWKANSNSAQFLQGVLKAERRYRYWLCRFGNVMARNSGSPSIQDLREFKDEAGHILTVDDPLIGKDVPDDQYPAEYPYDEIRPQNWGKHFDFVDDPTDPLLLDKKEFMTMKADNVAKYQKALEEYVDTKYPIDTAKCFVFSGYIPQQFEKYLHSPNVNPDLHYFNQVQVEIQFACGFSQKLYKTFQK